MTKTETILRVLFSNLKGAGLTDPRRNAVLDDVLDEIADQTDGKAGAYLILRDGQGKVTEQYLSDGYMMQHQAEIEWIVGGPEGDDLELAFDRGLEALGDVITRDPTLSGNVLSSRIVDAPERSFDELGSKIAKSALVTVEMEFTSDQPF